MAHAEDHLDEHEDHGEGDEYEEHEEPGHEDQDGASGSLDDWGFYTSLVYGQPLGSGVVEASLRYEYVSGEGEAGLSERRRISPGITWYANSQRTFFVRGQYNHDRIDGSDSEDSVWVGFGFNWGGPEVR
jgi:hypothetical protein